MCLGGRLVELFPGLGLSPFRPPVPPALAERLLCVLLGRGAGGVLYVFTHEPLRSILVSLLVIVPDYLPVHRWACIRGGNLESDMFEFKFRFHLVV